MIVPSNTGPSESSPSNQENGQSNDTQPQEEESERRLAPLKSHDCHMLEVVSFRSRCKVGVG